ncbi:uncharacterized protein LOC115433074 [Sphaeramia orbicularis]|uniref:uncharacterized protein LOC115433074 n=1 Tax=Sphaeramia orbicularis TaxID=375764 RepID=UPI0011800B84|nr:uncharacterized protein LOC115433074 [Sphaeramia orbicularis]XP_030010143.1 uncharacterized protein LOC115433074 [Sphaeramia orbicularis]XP_030010144.1 uncharacterized protein LOC115433074 [Sphaeramia orbicularis]
MTTTLMTVIMMMVMKSNAAQVFNKSVHRGEAVQLTSDLQELGVERIQDIRWTHLHLYLHNNTQKTGCDGRCELLNDGTLSFSRVESIDEGSYIQEVFDRKGKRLKKTEFILRVETDGSRVWGRASFSYMFFLLLPLIVIVYFILRRRSQRTEAAGSGLTQENVYIEMHSYHGNKRTEAVEEQKMEEVNPSTPITQQVPEEEDVYI